MADHVGACAAVLQPLHRLIEQHVMAAERLHGDDTPVPILAKGKTDTGRAWVYVRDDRPFGGADPPAVLFRVSRDRSGDHPDEHLRGSTGVLQADAYAGYNRLLAPDRQPGPVGEALCWAMHAGSSSSLPISPCVAGAGVTPRRSPSRRSADLTRRRATRCRTARAWIYKGNDGMQPIDQEGAVDSQVVAALGLKRI